MLVFGARHHLAIISVGNSPLSAGPRPSIQFVQELGSFAWQHDNSFEQVFEGSGRLVVWQINRRAHWGEALVGCRSLLPSCRVLSRLFT